MPLGRGLSALIPTKSGQVPKKTIEKITQETLKDTGERIFNIPINQIEPNPEQPRRNFSHQEMEELINSIREHGIIQPLIVSKLDNNKYQLIAGERRYRAAKILELETVPAIVRKVNEIEKLELSLLENIQRKDLNPIEKARAYQRLIDQFNLTQDEVAKKLGKARATISNTLRLLTLPEKIQEAIEEEKISEGHAKALLSIDSPEKQKILLKRILGLGLTVRETEKIVAGYRIKKVIAIEPQLIEKAKELSRILGTKVTIKKKKRGGNIVIEFYNNEDLDFLIRKLLGQ
ncbi:ParB/RepB/Spo0J family partition protein [bacterium]|nr:ParB/RepB/Spo0J family partition protein [bacterium]